MHFCGFIPNLAYHHLLVSPPPNCLWAVVQFQKCMCRIWPYKQHQLGYSCHTSSQFGWIIQRYSVKLPSVSTIVILISIIAMTFFYIFHVSFWKNWNLTSIAENPPISVLPMHGETNKVAVVSTRKQLDYVWLGWVGAYYPKIMLISTYSCVLYAKSRELGYGCRMPNTGHLNSKIRE